MACTKKTSSEGQNTWATRRNGRRRERHAKTHVGGQADEQAEREPAEPTVGREGVDVGIVRLQTEDQPEAQRPEAVHVVQQHRQGAGLVAEAPRRAFVVVLVERGALQEQIARLFERKQKRDRQGRDGQRPQPP